MKSKKRNRRKYVKKDTIKKVNKKYKNLTIAKVLAGGSVPDTTNQMMELNTYQPMELSEAMVDAEEADAEEEAQWMIVTTERMAISVREVAMTARLANVEISVATHWASKAQEMAKEGMARAAKGIAIVAVERADEAQKKFNDLMYAVEQMMKNLNLVFTRRRIMMERVAEMNAAAQGVELAVVMQEIKELEWRAADSVRNTMAERECMVRAERTREIMIRAGEDRVEAKERSEAEKNVPGAVNRHKAREVRRVAGKVAVVAEKAEVLMAVVMAMAARSDVSWANVLNIDMAEIRGQRATELAAGARAATEAVADAANQLEVVMENLMDQVDKMREYNKGQL